MRIEWLKKWIKWLDEYRLIRIFDHLIYFLFSRKIYDIITLSVWRSIHKLLRGKEKL